MNDSTFDVDSKMKNLEWNYGDCEKTCEMNNRDVKHKIKWAEDFFRF